MLRKILPAFLAAVLVISGCAASSPSDVLEQTDTPEQNFDAESLLDKMSIEEKISQMLFVRCDSSDIEGMTKKNPGGIVMFGVDFDDLSEKEVKDKISKLRSGCEIEPFIAVDEEGGTVVRVSSNPQLSDEKFKSPQAYYNEGGIENVIEHEIEKSKLLANLGITMNLAPVADLSTNPSDFIYDRALGRDAQTTAEFVSRTVTAMHENNMMSCLKHFPGYGGNLDTHTGIAIDERDAQSFRENDFIPFKAGIDAGTDAVLVAHNIVINMDSEQPASISPAVHEILRTELGFDGIIMTDDMSMGAMQDYVNPYEKAVLAGNDMIIVSDFDAAFNEILSAVNAGSVSEELIDSAVSRILNKKDI